MEEWIFVTNGIGNRLYGIYIGLLLHKKHILCNYYFLITIRDNIAYYITSMKAHRIGMDNMSWLNLHIF